MATAGDKFLAPGICALEGCDVALVLEGNSQLYACKHSLANVSEYFRKMFTGEFKEKYSKEVEIKDVSQADLLVFLSITQEPLKSMSYDADSLCSLIFLSDRFMCPSLKKDIETHLSSESMLKAPIETKLKLLVAADKYKGESIQILEACVRLCADLDWDTVTGLHGKVADGTLAALSVFVGRVHSERVNVFPVHECGNYGLCYFGGITASHQYNCRHCSKTQPIDSIDFEKVKQIEIDKNMLALKC